MGANIAQLEEVSGHEREQLTRRQLLIPSPEESQSDQPLWLSICEAELEEVSGHERRNVQTVIVECNRPFINSEDNF